MTIGVHRLEVQDDVLLMELYYMPNVPAGTAGETWSLFEMNGGSGSVAPLLTDRPNLTQYQVIGRSADQGWSVDNLGVEAADGQTVMWWGYFAAPPEGTDTLSVQIAPGHPILEVEVQR
ncbi:hypothetical protein [Litorihabitans aurantiacus]|uniref:Uncharacterized protein n=1 Tax=Litorihabitans aurantiacus TaxID=1930061 RepID=A0AA37UY75_9MICO|nr:hypothetical protein [Litorihabitans aurantiacus]GMA31297.1 hypothetical protein GCM10025875_12890 [Litorihabitans aurantiacus]